MRQMAGIFMLIMWIGGIVLAKGFWSTFAGIFMPFWAWYLVIERAMQVYGMAP